MKLKNFFLSCSSTSGGRSRKVEEKQQKYGGLRPVSPPPPPHHPSSHHTLTTLHPTNKATIDPLVAAYLRQGQSHGGQDYYTGPTKKHLTNSYSSYSCGSASSESSSHSSTKSGSGASSSSSGIGSYSSSNSNPNSLSKNKRTLDSRSGKHRSSNSTTSERQKSRCTSRQCSADYHHQHHQNKTLPPDYGLGTPSPDDLGVKVGHRVVWLREAPHSNESGIVKWIGWIEHEEIAGIEFDRQLGLGSGWYKNRQLFTCEPQCGGLVAVAGLILEEDFLNPELDNSSYASITPEIPNIEENVEHNSWKSPAVKEVSESSYLGGGPALTIVDCGNWGIYNPTLGEFENPSNTEMPIPHIVQPLREENVEQINGRLKGIQGHRNSCYLDATLFSMFSFSSVFDSILLQDYRRADNRRNEDDETLARDVQKILRDEIVNPLRKDLYCQAANVMNLRKKMEHLDGKLTCEEMDPQEFLQLLFDKVLNLDEFMSLSSGQSDFFHQVLVQEKDQDRHKIPTIQQLFEQSLMLQELKLKSVPQPALILQMPRSGNKYKMYEGILPNLTIDITDLLEDIPRMCIICGSLANYECSSCYGKFNSGGEARENTIGSSPVGSGAESTAFCETCVKQIHKRKERQGHMTSIVPIRYSFSASQYFPNAINNTSSSTSNNSITSSTNNPSSYFFGHSPQIGNWGNPSFNRNPPNSITPLISSIPPPSNSNFNNSYLSPTTHSRSIPRVTMDLFAVICIETSHFVSFVKCGPDRQAPWVFFDSMADRVENATTGTGHNIPQVRLLPKMGMWLNDLESHEDVKQMMEKDGFPPELKRLLADPYICLYYSKESSMYS